MNTNETEPSEILTVKLFSQKYPIFSESSLRNIIFHAKANGFDVAIYRLGRKVLIDVPKFFAKVKQQSGGNYAPAR